MYIRSAGICQIGTSQVRSVEWGARNGLGTQGASRLEARTRVEPRGLAECAVLSCGNYRGSTTYILWPALVHFTGTACDIAPSASSIVPDI